MSDKINNLEEEPAYNTSMEDNILYNCTECSSMIEIIEINKEIIQFKCINNKHERIMEISEYLDKMKKYRNIKINNDKCNMHNNNGYISYCLNCNIHLCNECLKKREHINHYKNYLIEINPNKEELNLIKEMIKENKNKIKNLEMKRDDEYRELNNNIKINSEKKEKLNENMKEKIEKEEEKEIELNKENYKKEIKIIKKEYEKKKKEKK